MDESISIHGEHPRGSNLRASTRPARLLGPAFKQQHIAAPARRSQRRRPSGETLRHLKRRRLPVARGAAAALLHVELKVAVGLCSSGAKTYSLAIGAPARAPRADVRVLDDAAVALDPDLARIPTF